MRLHEQPELAVDVADLEQVAQVVVVGEAAGRGSPPARLMPSIGSLPGRPALVTRRAGRSTARGGAARGGSRRSAAGRSRIAPIHLCRRAGRPPPARRLSTPGRRVRAPAQIRGGQTRRAGLDLDHVVPEPVHAGGRCSAGGCARPARSRPRHARVEDRRHRLEGRVVDGAGRCGTRSRSAPAPRSSGSGPRRCGRPGRSACRPGTRRRRGSRPAGALLARSRAPAPSWPPSATAATAAPGGGAARGCERTRRNVDPAHRGRRTYASSREQQQTLPAATSNSSTELRPRERALGHH